MQPRILNASSVIVWSRKGEEEVAHSREQSVEADPERTVYAPVVACMGKLGHLQLWEKIGRLSWDLGSR